MKVNNINWWSLCANLSAILGFLSICSALLSKFNLVVSMVIIEYWILAGLYGLFPLFFLFIANQIISGFKSKDKNNGKTTILDGLVTYVTKPFIHLSKISRLHLIVSLFLFICGVYMQNTEQIAGVQWTFDTPFQREHAISFGITSALFYALMIPFYSYWAMNNVSDDDKSIQTNNG
jgi:hypothetical protein